MDSPGEVFRRSRASFFQSPWRDFAEEKVGREGGRVAAISRGSVDGAALAGSVDAGRSKKLLWANVEVAAGAWDGFGAGIGMAGVVAMAAT